MSFTAVGPAVSNIKLTTDAGVSRSIKTGASPLRISDNEFSAEKHALASEPVSSYAVRTQNRVSVVSGVMRPKIDANKSIAYGDRAFLGKL